MNEKPFGECEPAPEHVPSKAEVEGLFSELVGDRKYEITRETNDERGLLLLEITVKDGDGSYSEYEYTRELLKPREGAKRGPYIWVAFYDESGYPTGGHSVGKYVNDRWILTP